MAFVFEQNLETDPVRSRYSRRFGVKFSESTRPIQPLLGGPISLQDVCEFLFASKAVLRDGRCVPDLIRMSRQCHDKLSEQIVAMSPDNMRRARFDMLFGVKVEIDPTLPPVRPIKSHDRFCEYGPKDMWWAEPLGLASWVGEEVHAVAHYGVERP